MMLAQCRKKKSGFGLVAMCSVLVAGFAMDAKAEKRAKKSVAPMVFDATKRKKTKTKINETLSYSAYTSFRYLGERNLRLDTTTTDKTDEFGGYVGLVLRGKFSERIQAFAHAELDLRRKITSTAQYPVQPRLNVKEAQVSFKLSDQSHLTVGRLRFSDAHKWIADASVDGVHFGYKSENALFEAAVFQDVFNDGGRYALLHTARFNSTGHSGAYILAEQTNAERRVHLAGYTKKQASDAFTYHILAAAVLGEVAQGQRAGFGFDARATYKFKGTQNPQVTFGLAAGTSGFQQSGLHSNKTYAGGQTQVHRYGYVFQPELTNLAVASVGLGLRPSRQFSVDLNAHAYAQVSTSTLAPNARVTGSTNGTSRFVGAEISLVGAWRPSKKTKVEFGLGGFKPGPAYTQRGSAKRVYARFSMYF